MRRKVVVTSARKNAGIDVPSTSSRPIGDITCSVRHIDIGLYHFKSDFDVSPCQYKYHKIESQVFDSTCADRRTGPIRPYKISGEICVQIAICWLRTKSQTNLRLIPIKS